MSLENYYTLNEIAKKLDMPESTIGELCDDYDIFLRRINEENQLKFHSSCLGMLRYIIERLKKGIDTKEIKKSLGFDRSFLCHKDKELCQ